MNTNYHINNPHLSVFAEILENSALTALTWHLFSLTRVKPALFWSGHSIILIDDKVVFHYNSDATL